MAQIERLPSGNWRARVFYVEKGKRKSKSFTAEKKKTAKLLAARFELEVASNVSKPNDITVGDAIDRYIDSKTAILSPSTIHEYRRVRNDALQSLMGIKLTELTQEKIQLAVNEDAASHSPKTVKNHHGLLTATLAEYHPAFVLKTKLPPKVKLEITVPEDKNIKKMLLLCAGSQLETAILFGATLGLRRSEICALSWEDVDLDKKTVRINKAYVLNDKHEWVLKGTKTYSSTRTLTMSNMLAEHLRGLDRNGENILTVNPDALTNRFCKLRTKCGFKFRFHDLRHYNASVMLAKNIPDKYAMKQLGHATMNMLQNVYQHLIKEKEAEVAATLNSFMDETFG